MWDSTGPKGGQGSKFQRAYVSEIVGFDATVGKKVRSRIDPLEIERVASPDRVFNSADPNEVWTVDSGEAEKDKKGNPVHASRGSESGEAGQPSKLNHGNIPPSIDAQAGGVTISKALQTTVISFATLRRLRFKGFGREAETAARTAIAALGVAAIAYQHETDYDLRSRCLLLPTHPPRIELLSRDGSAGEIVDLDRTAASGDSLGCGRSSGSGGNRLGNPRHSPGAGPEASGTDSAQPQRLGRRTSCGVNSDGGGEVRYRGQLSSPAVTSRHSTMIAGIRSGRHIPRGCSRRSLPCGPTPTSADRSEREALEWLEAPGTSCDLSASHAVPRRVVSHFVPVNDIPSSSFAAPTTENSRMGTWM